MTVMERISPALLDRYMLQGDRMFKKQKTNQPDDGQVNLFAPLDGKGSTTGDFGERSKSTSLYTRYLELHPNRKRLLTALGLLGGLVLVRRLGR